ncbi:G-D-S-L family lipolytic protein [Seonamhaeicola sp.]|uniref:G-D-S-L family lipolytic protein n=1 Tax=Seonamhaeicola sp. TaxID=1912245 RepID=UPI002630E031|nr:G-D-S-L family lipolytic protein [Seonamhaeicola sp.]
MNTKYILLLLIIVGFTACNDPEDVLRDFNIEPDTTPELPALTTGSADFSKYVAVGASFTAGYTDGALFKASQENSFTNMLAKEFAKAGGGDYNQPLMNDNIGGLLFGGVPNPMFEPRLFFNGEGPVRLPATPTTEAFNTLSGPFQNIGVPGAKSFHMLFEGYGNPAGLVTSPATANPYFVRMASNPNASMIGDAIAQNPTFFTLSLMGGNDVIDYAFWGGDSSRAVTDSPTFDFAFTTAVNVLTSGGAKGVVTNVPYIEDLPHFTRVPHNPVPLDAGTAAVLNQAYAAYNGGIQQALAALSGLGLFTEEEALKRTINFAAGQNAVVIEDESLTDLGAINPAFAALPKYRQATAEDIIVLSASTFIGTEAIPGNPQTVNGLAIPLADRWVLTPEEQQEIKDATDAYNNTIEGIVASNDNLALVNLKDLLFKLSTTGLSSNNFTLTSDLVTGGAIGLDGIHLTARGYGLLANEFLKAIDAQFGSNFMESGNMINIGDYPTNYSPTLQ